MFLYTMADFMAQPHLVDLTPDGWVVFPDGDRFPVEDFGDCLLSPVPLDDAFEQWCRHLDSPAQAV